MISSVSTSIATVILLIAVGGWILYAIFNARATRAEVGSEIELAANRKEYYDDEILEGRKIERTQLLGILFLAIVAVDPPDERHQHHPSGQPCHRDHESEPHTHIGGEQQICSTDQTHRHDENYKDSANFWFPTDCQQR